jgi:hypothetical protein
MLGGDYFIDPEYQESDPFWNCEVCGEQNSRLDGDCQYCECGGFGKCKRSNCDDIRHFHRGIQLTAMRMLETRSNMERWFPGGLPELARIQKRNMAQNASPSL